jgi:hypothetical protein
VTLPKAAVQSASKRLPPRRSLVLVGNDERRSEKSLSCSIEEFDKSTRLSPLSDVLGIAFE